MVKEMVTSGLMLGLGNNYQYKPDYLLVGQELEFIGIANGNIYYKKNNGELESIIHHKFEDDWDYYVDPNTL